MSETRRKLDEARFFLDLMEKHYLEVPGFSYYLSAFISAARSVLWVMRAEHAPIDGWEAWFDSKNVDPELETFLSRINDLRIRSVKRGTPVTSAKVELSIRRENFTPELERFLKDHVGQMCRVSLSGPPQEHPPPPAPTTVEEGGFSVPGVKLADVYRVVEEFPEEDVLKVAQRYYVWLEGLVSECEGRFGV
jgi:hypothetical protein